MERLHFKDWREELRKALDGYCSRNGKKPTMVAKDLFNDASFFSEVLDEGRKCSVDKFQEAMRYLSADLVGAE